MADGHNHHHDLKADRAKSQSRMAIVLALTGSYMIIEVVTGFFTHSLAMLADAGHMLSDFAAILLALVAVWFSNRPATHDKTYGYYRSEILASFVNSLALVGMSAFILFEAYRRFSSPHEVAGLPVLIVALVGFGVNLISLKLLGAHSHNSLNVKAAYLEVMSDLLATIGVVVSSLVILATKWYAIDAIVSALIGIGILPRTWNLLKECINILMEGTPGHVDLGTLRKAMMGVDGVVDVHDIHVWTITSGLDAMSGHVTIDSKAPAEAVLTEVTRLVRDDFGLHHTTIQVEQVECKGETCST